MCSELYAERLAQARDTLGLSTNKFAADADLGPSNVAKMLRGEMPITDRTLRAVAKAHGVSYQWLLSGDGEMMMPTPAVTLSGNGNVNVNGSNVEQTYSSGSDEVEFLRRQLEEANARCDRLLKLLETFTRNLTASKEFQQAIN